MQIISKASGDIAKLWDEGKILPVVYRMMTYVISSDVEGGVLLHNAITGELLFLDNEEASHLSDLPCLYAPWMDELIKKHFLVRTDADDKKTVDGLRTALKLLLDTKDITGYTVLPTTNCNARCFYCYEAGCEHTNMTDETADHLVDFIDAHRGGKPVHIAWFGGEPLVGIHQIDRICRALTEKKIPFHSSMTSNAYLFNKETALRAKEEWKLNQIQITLDGTEKIYNETKAYVNACENPYERVLENIRFLMENQIRVTVRLNLGMHNFDDLTSLVEDLCERFPDRTYLRIYSHILFDDCGFEPTHFKEEELKLLYEKQEALENQIRESKGVGSLGNLPRLRKNWCMSDNSSSVVVFPSGRLGKCEHYIETNPVGTVETGITDKQEMKNYAERVVLSECAVCPLYPDCIILKVCQTNTCTPILAHQKKSEKIRTIKEYYERFLKKEKMEDNECVAPQEC